MYYLGWRLVDDDGVLVICLVSGNQMLRTVYLPNEHSDLLVLLMESLKTQLEDQEKMLEQKARMMADMMHTRALEHKKRVVMQKDNIKHLKRALRQMHNQCTERNQEILLVQGKLRR